MPGCLRDAPTENVAVHVIGVEGEVKGRRRAIFAHRHTDALTFGDDGRIVDRGDGDGDGGRVGQRAIAGGVGEYVGPVEVQRGGVDDPGRAADGRRAVGWIGDSVQEECIAVQVQVVEQGLKGDASVFGRGESIALRVRRGDHGQRVRRALGGIAQLVHARGLQPVDAHQREFGDIVPGRVRQSRCFLVALAVGQLDPYRDCIHAAAVAHGAAQHGRCTDLAGAVVLHDDLGEGVRHCQHRRDIIHKDPLRHAASHVANNVGGLHLQGVRDPVLRGHAPRPEIGVFTGLVGREQSGLAPRLVVQLDGHLERLTFAGYVDDGAPDLVKGAAQSRRQVQRRDWAFQVNGKSDHLRRTHLAVKIGGPHVEMPGVAVL